MPSAADPLPRLIEELRRLNLVQPRELGRVGAQVRRLGEPLSSLEWPWLDALLAGGVLTSYQVAAIAGGRAATLKVASYLLLEPVARPFFGALYCAQHLETGRLAWLALIPASPNESGRLVGELSDLTGRRELSQLEGAVQEVGFENDHCYVAGDWMGGHSAAEWTARYGTMATAVLVETIHGMVQVVAELERLGIRHGGISIDTTLLCDRRPVLLAPGLRPLLARLEKADTGCKRSGGLEKLAAKQPDHPLRQISHGDLYDCACVWWHLLTGRRFSAFSGVEATGNGHFSSLRKHLAELAPDRPLALSDLIAGCLAPDQKRPTTISEVVEASHRLGGGAAAHRGRTAPDDRRPARFASTRPARQPPRWPYWMVAATCLIVSIMAVLRSPLPALSPSPASPPMASVVTPTKSGAAESPRIASIAPADSGATQAQRGKTQSSDGAPEGDRAADVVAAHALVPMPEFRLSDSTPIASETIPLNAGSRVGGQKGKRARVTVPQGGWQIGAEDLTLEDLDFLPSSPKPGGGALLVVRASRVTFRRCRFGTSLHGPAVAIQWTAPSRPAETVALPAGRLVVEDCIWRDCDTAIRSERSGAVVVQMVNCLVVGLKSTIHLPRLPSADEPVAIVLDRLTLRRGATLLECDHAGEPDGMGPVTVRATACALAPDAGGALVLLRGSNPTASSLESLRWAGQGSLLENSAAVVRYQAADGRCGLVDDAALAVAGLVRGEIGFAGPADGDPANQQVVRWQAPLLGGEAPGAETARLPRDRQ